MQGNPVNAARWTCISMVLVGLLLVAGLPPTVWGHPLTFDREKPKTSLLPPPRATDADKRSADDDQDQPAHGKAHQVVVNWNNNLLHMPDPGGGGRRVTVVSGRMFLFGSTTDYPLAGDGLVTVELFDETKGPARPLERWTIEPMTLDRLLRRDMIGWGYTLSLPWSACKPGPATVRLKLRYLPVQGTPVSSDSGLFTLSCEEANAKGD